MFFSATAHIKHLLSKIMSFAHNTKCGNLYFVFLSQEVISSPSAEIERVAAKQIISFYILQLYYQYKIA